MNMTETALSRLRAYLGIRCPDTFVETGTWQGDTARLATHSFAVVHTIERSRVLYDRAAGRWTKVQYHHGDSRQVLPRLQLDGPILFYLDAHYGRVPGMEGKDDFPLWGELEWISQRPQPDVVVIDDVQYFDPGAFIWGSAKPVTTDAIAAAVGRIHSARVMGDQYVIVRQEKLE